MLCNPKLVLVSTQLSGGKSPILRTILTKRQQNQWQRIGLAFTVHPTVSAYDLFTIIQVNFMI